MTPWTDKYVGAPYIPCEGDCAALAARVAKEELGLDICFPQHADGLFAQAIQVRALRGAYAEHIDAPEDKQPVLLLARARFFHIGVIALLGGIVHVLHADQTSGYVVCQRLADLTTLAYQLEGFYRWKSPQS